MSVEAAKTFLKKLESDSDLAAKLEAAGGSAAEAVKLGAGVGLEFTVEELQEANDELYGELSDEDLASAVGGLGGIRPPISFD